MMLVVLLFVSLEHRPNGECYITMNYNIEIDGLNFHDGWTFDY